MRQRDSVDAQLQRLMRIDWNIKNPPRNSYILLLREYIRRMAFWAIALEQPDRWPHWVEFEVASEIAPIEDYIEQQSGQLMGYLDAQRVPILTKIMCKYSLEWAALSESQISHYSLPEPYEPLIVMFERGGTYMRYDHGYFEVNLASIPPQNTSIHDRAVEKPITSLDKASLDAVDENEW